MNRPPGTGNGKREEGKWPDRSMPFLAIVEHTNFVGPENYAGNHIVYISNYLEPGHEYFNLTEDQLWALFEPRSNTMRRKILQKELVHSLALADEIVVTTVFHAEAVPQAERLDTAAVVTALRRQKKPARELADADAIVAAIAPQLLPGDVVVILSNGAFGNIYEKLPQRLRSEVPA